MEDLLRPDYMTKKTRVYVVPGKPVPLARPRLSPNGIVYDCQRSLKTKAGLIIKEQHSRDATLCGMLHLHIDFFMQLPSSKTSRKHLLQQQYHVYKPDISNLIKFIEDVCVEINMIEDDSLIASISARKLYSEQPRTEFYFDVLRKETEYEE